jgi:hypothetical protein
MKANIYGLSDATIAFNSLGITLRGKAPEAAGSVARDIDINDEHQINEVRQLESAGLIRVEEIGVTPKTENVTEVVPETAPSTSRRKNLMESIQEEEDPAIMGTVDEAIENPEQTELDKIKAKELADAKPKVEPVVEVVQEDTRVVVMTPGGPVDGDMVHKMSGEVDESDPKCKASMDAARALDRERFSPDDEIDESQLDPSEQMGGTAVIGTGGGNAAKSAMTNNIFGDLPEPNFIDDKEDQEPEAVEEEVAEEAEEVEETSPFIDLAEDNEEEDELGDAFIEI